MGRLVKKVCCVATLVMSSYCAAADQADAKDTAFFEETCSAHPVRSLRVLHNE
jgi:hypothetical protein